MMYIISHTCHSYIRSTKPFRLYRWLEWETTVENIAYNHLYLVHVVRLPRICLNGPSHHTTIDLITLSEVSKLTPRCTSDKNVSLALDSSSIEYKMKFNTDKGVWYKVYKKNYCEKDVHTTKMYAYCPRQSIYLRISGSSPHSFLQPQQFVLH